MGGGRKRASSLSPGLEPGNRIVKVTRFFSLDRQVQSEGLLGSVRRAEGVCLHAEGEAAVPGAGEIIALHLFYY